MDWTSIVLHGKEAKLGKHGYSRDHRPDKKQITLGVSELADPINIPIGMTVEPGNINDTTHFKKTYGQLSGRLKEGSLVIFDKGANSVHNVAMIRADNLQYMTAKCDKKLCLGLLESYPIRLGYPYPSVRYW